MGSLSHLGGCCVGGAAVVMSMNDSVSVVWCPNSVCIMVPVGISGGGKGIMGPLDDAAVGGG